MRLFHICLFACPVAGHWHAVCGSHSLALSGVWGGGVLCCCVCADTVPFSRSAPCQNAELRPYRISVVNHSSSAHCAHTPLPRTAHTHRQDCQSGLRSADAVTAVVDRFGPSWPNSHLGSPHAKFWARVLRYFSPCYGLLPPLHKRRDGARDATATTSIAGTCYRGFVRRAS